MSYIDKEILKMCRRNVQIKNILKWVVKECPLIDEIVCLARIINLFKINGFEVKESQMKVAFKTYYDKEIHGDMRSYLKWLRNLDGGVK